MDETAVFVRGFEVVGITIYIAALIMALRQRHPVYLGLFFICNTMIAWDWVFNCKWFFNVVFDPRLTALWVVGEERETLAAGLAFVAFYYWVFHLLWRHQAKLDARLGARQFVVLYVGFMIYDLVFEALLIHLGIYSYYQREPYLLLGVPWSNMIFNANLSVLSYLALRQVRRWGQIPDELAFEPGRDEFWKGFCLPGAAITTAFYLSFMLQLVWYVIAEPWSAGPRAF